MLDGREEVDRRADAHQVARARVVAERVGDDVQGRRHLGLRLPHRQAADRDPVERQPPIAATDARRSSGSTPPWTMPKTAWSGAARRERALAQRCVWPSPRRPPARGSPGIHELVERHRHVRPEERLDLHRPLGGEPMRRAVEVRGEGHPVVVDPPQVGQAEDLEAARIGQDRSVPAHEPMQAAEAARSARRRPQAEVVRVAEDHLRAGRAQVAGVSAFTVAWVPTGMNCGRVDRAVRCRQCGPAGRARPVWARS